MPCPIPIQQSNLKRSESNPPVIPNETTASFKAQHNEEVKQIFDNLRTDMEKMEQSIKLAEIEVSRKEEESFFRRQDENEISQLKLRQLDDLKHKKEVHDALLQHRAARRKVKKLQTEMNREAKERDLIIQQQEAANRTADQEKLMLAEQRASYDALSRHIEERQVKQRKQLSAAQERKVNDSRALIDIETRRLKEELRMELLKDFAYKMNHRKAIDKKISDHLREVQQLELKQYKEKFELETRLTAEMFGLQAQHKHKINEAEIQHKREYQNEKERIADIRETIKNSKLNSLHNAEMKRLLTTHKVQIRQLQRRQKLRGTIRLKKWKEQMISENNDEEVDEDQVGTLSSALQSFVSNPQSTSISHASSFHSIMDDQNSLASNSQLVFQNPNREEDDTDSKMTEQMIEQALFEEQRRNEEQLKKLLDHLASMASQKKELLSKIRQEQKAELKAMEESIQKRMSDLEFQHEAEMRSLKRQQECEIEEMKNIQEREYQMESNLRLAERKMLVERRTLNSILDTVIDGVINIDPEGIVKRFNSAAEKMFGYSASEVMGKNIKMLMPIHYAEKHDGFLKNYFTTGTKKVIGYGRTVQGQKKNGQLFPIHLSVSEVKEDDVHIFTGIIRDLTEEEAAQEAAKALQKQKQDELEKLVKQLDSEKSRSKGLIKEMLPSTIVDKLLSSEPIPPQSYDEATILFTDLCGFTEICSRSSPMDIVNMLNDLYSKFDSVITQYNVYKVETIGDAYMVVSGIPNETPNHAVEIAKLSVHLMKVISTLIVRHCPDIKLRMRIGIHSGPCVAGIVGRKMPRYCLFGDTVNTASRMESSGEPMKIHVSETSYKFLTKAGGCKFSTRGEISVKGKGAMKTYWLEGIDGFDPEVPQTCATVYSTESTEDKLKL